MNFLDKIKSYASSSAAVEIARNRAAVAQYESVSGSGRKVNTSTQSPSALTKMAQKPLAQQARYYEENFGIVSAMLDEITVKVVGDGINVNPQPKLLNGELAAPLAKQLASMYEMHSRLFCMEGRTQRFEAERLFLRTFVRDGEAFARMYNQGSHSYLTQVKSGVELFECDHIDAGLTDKALNIHNGIQLGDYNRVEGYLYNKDPNAFGQNPTLIPSSEILHLANKNRIGSLRGISKLAPVIGDIADLANFKEASQLALKAAVKITMIHEVSNSSLVEKLTDDDEPLDLEFGYSNVLQVPKGDSVKMVESAKGIGDTVKAILSMQKQITSGTGVSHSSTTSNYERSYSAQRQELIDRWASYMVLRTMLISNFCRPTYEQFVNAAFIQGILDVPKDIDFSTLFNAEFTGAVMPWIDPKKEAESIKILMGAGLLPLSLALAQRGLDITNVLTRYAQDRKLQSALGLDDINFIENATANAGGSNGKQDNNADSEDDE
ncbi:Phage portal protein [Vibrio chagasii]|nr:Phage portal protein [Vibrio chagasii]